MISINGVRQPVLTMRPGETQRWRILNACAQLQIRIPTITNAAGSGPQIAWRQIAQDGVQFHFVNYNQPNPSPAIAPGNRVDLLVKAPSTPGRYIVQAKTFPFPGDKNIITLLTVNVAGAPVSSKDFPGESDYPKMPDFLADIDPGTIFVKRSITFSSTSGGKSAIGRGSGFGPTHAINGKQFSNNDIDQIMKLNSTEEWTLYNSAPLVQHPFHIHVNPFQVVEVFDPNQSDKPFVLPAPYVWWDTIAIPAANGSTPGYIKIRHRFADFTGFFVFHCHILAHEDRGMMQLVQVVSDKTTLEHNH